MEKILNCFGTLEDNLDAVLKLYCKERKVKPEEVIARDLIPEEDLHYSGKEGNWHTLEVPEGRFILLCGTKAGKLEIRSADYCTEAIYTNYNGLPYLIFRDNRRFFVKGDWKNLKGYVIERICVKISFV